MAHIPTMEESGPQTLAKSDSDNTSAFIGCSVPRALKLKIVRMAMDAPGGSRTVSWAINKILAEYFNKEQDAK